jgi:hypothetical protein
VKAERRFAFFPRFFADSYGYTVAVIRQACRQVVVSVLEIRAFHRMHLKCLPLELVCRAASISRNFPLGYSALCAALNAQMCIHVSLLPSFPIVPLSRLVAAACFGNGRERTNEKENSGRTYGYLTGKVIARTYPPDSRDATGTAEDGSPEFYYPCFFVKSRRGRPFLSLSGDISPRPAETLAS